MKIGDNFLGLLDKEKIEYYTPRNAIIPLLEIVPKDKTIWCPADTKESEIVKVFKENNYKVIYSHIWNNQDFFEYEPKEHYDIIITNPPFKGKRKWVERAKNLNKEFLFLMPNTIFTQECLIRILFNLKNPFFSSFNKRIKFIRNDWDTVTAQPFFSVHWIGNFKYKKQLVYFETYEPKIYEIPEIHTKFKKSLLKNEIN